MKTIGKFFTVVIIIGAVILSWLVFSANTTFNSQQKYLYIYPTGQPAALQIEQQLNSGKIIDNVKVLDFIARHSGVYTHLTPGRLTVKKGTSVYGLLKLLRQNKQDTINFTVKRVRTRQGLAAMLGKNLMTDSAQAFAFLSNNDSLRPFGVDTFTLNTLLIPGTYQFQWQNTLPQVLTVWAETKRNFWNHNNRKARAAALGLTPEQASTLASIVEDETLKNSEKDTIASVYLNRLRTDMPLGADPTIKYALGDFELKRIMNTDLKVNSPYNTYINKGLPPGPICTPDSVTIEAVLNAPKTDYIYFVAKPDFSGYHNFSADYQQHLQLAQAFHDALDKRNIQ